MMKRFIKNFLHGERGFTLIELLVVVAILGVLAAVAVPNVGSFINRGKTEALETELHNIQTATMAMLADSKNGTLTGAGPIGPTTDMSSVTAAAVADADDSGASLILSNYMTGLDATFNAKAAVAQGKTYTFADNGTVTQN